MFIYNYFEEILQYIYNKYDKKDADEYTVCVCFCIKAFYRKIQEKKTEIISMFYTKLQ